MTIRVEVVADSVSPEGVRLTTVQVDIPRFILAQLNTHRMLSSNAQSSRAVPTERLLEQVRTSPAIPVFWGRNKAGMSADGVECDKLVGISGWPKEREEAWRNAAYEAAYYAEQFAEAGYHKEIVNRLIEPFMWTRVVISATEWDNFFHLRCHEDAQPDIKYLADLIKQRMRASYPHEMSDEEWHTPYFANGWWTPESGVPLKDALKISVSCCAQVSYRKLDDSLEKADKVFNMLHLLNNSAPGHYTPTEHQATPIWEDWYMWDPYDIPGVSHTTEDDSWSGNFRGWSQLRKQIEQGKSVFHGNI